MDGPLFRLYAATFLFVTLMGVGFPLIPQHLQVTFGSSLAMIGLVMGVHGIMQIVLRLPMGDMADRKGRRRSMQLTFLMTTAAGLFFVWAPSAWWILPGQVLFGLGSGIFWVAANAYLFDRVAQADVPKATSDYALAVGFGFLVGPPLSGWLADRYGFEVALSLFIWLSLAAFALVMTLPEASLSSKPPPPPGGVHARAWRILKHPDILVSALGTLLFSLCFAALGAFYPVYLRDLTYTAFLIGILVGVRQGVSLIIRFWLPGWIARFGPRSVLLGGLGIAGISVGLTPLVTTLWPFVALSVLAGLGLGVMIPANLTLVSRGSPPNERGLANGIYGTALGLGTASASWVLGYLGSAAGIAWTFLGAALVATIGGAITYVYAWRHPMPPTPTAAEGPVPEPGPA